jgi:hypothetical protein
MTQPLESTDPTLTMWCGRSWEGLVDRRCTAFEHALSMQRVIEATAGSVIDSFLAFLAGDGSEFFADEEKWVLDPLSKDNVPSPVLRAYRDHVEISLLAAALFRERAAGFAAVTAVRRLGEMLEQHLLMEEEEIRPLLRPRMRFDRSRLASA